MSSSWLGRFSLRCFHAPRRVDGGELVLERSAIGLRKLLDRAHGAERTHRCAKKSNAGDEEKGFFLGGSWHAPP